MADRRKKAQEPTPVDLFAGYENMQQSRELLRKNQQIKKAPAPAPKKKQAGSKRGQVVITYLVVLAVIIYLLGQFFNFLNKDNTNYIIAAKGEIVETIALQSVVVRDEMLVKATSDGIVQYHYAGGTELMAGTLVCSILDDYYGDILQEKIDQIYAQLADMGSAAVDNEAFTSLDTSVAQSVAQYLRNKSTGNYSSLYLLKTSLTESVSERKDMYSLASNSKISNLLSEQGIYLNEQSSVVSELYLSSGGLIDYSYDGYEGWTAEQIGPDFMSNYNSFYSYFEINMQSVKTGDPLYRLVYSPVWYLVMYLNEEEAQFFSGLDSVEFIYNSSDKLHGRVTTLQETGYDQYKLVIKLTERVQEFMNDRIATIVFNKNSHTGIKLSDACLLTREYLVIPKKYLMKNGEDYGYLVLGNDTSYFQKITIVDEDDEWVYYSLPEGAPTTVTIQMQSSLETMLTGATGSLFGVYVVNGGHERFQSVKVKYQAQGYSIVEGVDLYDRIKINRN
ncbi:MAG: hypothetical protein HUJ69_05585 [Lachnospiraceae bacterium]|nr:hypothetical protein [Lachnospiraceae bacterium]